MIGFVPDVQSDRALKLLCLGAHPDDLEIGCAATILALCEQYRVEARWVVLSGEGGTREPEARQGANAVLGQAAEREVLVAGFRDGYFPYDLGLKEYFETRLKDFEPDLILTHTREDRHQDHGCVSNLTWNTFRHHSILEYEVPKYDGDLGRPNVYVAAERRHVDAKTTILMSSFPSQASRSWFDPVTFNGLMRLRGVECASSTGFAEAFVGRKITLGIGADGAVIPDTSETRDMAVPGVEAEGGS